MTKEWLRQCRNIELEISILEESKEAAYQSALAKGIDISKDKVMSSSRNNVEDKFIAYSEYSRLLDKKVAELRNKQLTLQSIIGELRNPLHRVVIQLYYIDCLSWEDIASRMCYSLRQVHRFHGEALLIIRNIGDE